MTRLMFCLALLTAPAAFADEAQQEPMPPRSVFGFIETSAVPVLPLMGSIGTSLGDSSTAEYSFSNRRLHDDGDEISSHEHSVRVRYFPSRSMTFNFSAGWSFVSNTIAYTQRRYEKAGSPELYKPYRINVLKTGPELLIGNWWQWDHFSLRFDWFGVRYLFGVEESGGSKIGIERAQARMSQRIVPGSGVNYILARSGIGLSF